MTPETGKLYLTRDGQKAGPINRTPNLAFPFAGMVGDLYMGAWTSDGMSMPEVISEDDLVAEWGEEQT